MFRRTEADHVSHLLTWITYMNTMIAFSERGKRRMVEAGITTAMCRAARAIVQWSQADLAERAKVSRTTLVKFEQGGGAPHANNLAAIRAAFEAAGFQFAISADDGRASMSFDEPWR